MQIYRRWVGLAGVGCYVSVTDLTTTGPAGVGQRLMTHPALTKRPTKNYLLSPLWGGEGHEGPHAVSPRDRMCEKEPVARQATLRAGNLRTEASATPSRLRAVGPPACSSRRYVRPKRKPAFLHAFASPRLGRPRPSIGSAAVLGINQRSNARAADR